VRPRLDGLSDDEYVWEPVAGCWSVRRRGEARTSMAALAQPVGDKEPYPQLPVAALVLHINREAIHHASEVLLLRDLYRGRP
jgi:hypothetical protein